MAIIHVHCITAHKSRVGVHHFLEFSAFYGEIEGNGKETWTYIDVASRSTTSCLDNLKLFMTADLHFPNL